MKPPKLPLPWIRHSDPGFEKGGGAGESGACPKIYLANLGNFLKNLTQKGVGVRPPLNPRLSVSQQKGEVYQMLFQCWASVADTGPTLKQHWLRLLWSLGCYALICFQDVETMLKQCCPMFNPFKSEFIIVIFSHYKPRIAVAILDL